MINSNLFMICRCFVLCLRFFIRFVFRCWLLLKRRFGVFVGFGIWWFMIVIMSS